jgi:hemoglobin
MSADVFEELDAEAKASCPNSPFVAVGGSSAVSAVVDEFYRRLLADPSTSGFFASLLEADGLPALKRHQVLLLAKVLGGPDRYPGRDLGVAHEGMAITAAAYRRVSLYLLTVLHEFGVPMDILEVADSTLREVGPAIISA